MSRGLVQCTQLSKLTSHSCGLTQSRTAFAFFGQCHITIMLCCVITTDDMNFMITAFHAEGWQKWQLPCWNTGCLVRNCNGLDCVVVSAEVETAASSGVNPFPNSEGGQDVKLRVSIRVLRARGLPASVFSWQRKRRSSNKTNSARWKEKRLAERQRYRSGEEREAVMLCKSLIRMQQPGRCM